MATSNSLPEYSIDDYQIPGVQAPAKPDILKQYMNTQLDQAKQFRNNIPTYSNQLYGQTENTARQNLAQGIKNVQKDYNRRGLLRSGGRIGAEYGQRAQTESGLANAKVGINQGLNTAADQMEANAINTGYGYAGMQPDMTSMALQGQQNALAHSIANMNTQSQAFNNIFGGALGGLGYYLGGRK